MGMGSWALPLVFCSEALSVFEREDRSNVKQTLITKLSLAASLRATVCGVW